jgi:hypothetical protein
MFCSKTNGAAHKEFGFAFLTRKEENLMLFNAVKEK